MNVCVCAISIVFLFCFGIYLVLNLTLMLIHIKGLYIYISALFSNTRRPWILNTQITDFLRRKKHSHTVNAFICDTVNLTWFSLEREPWRQKLGLLPSTVCQRGTLTKHRTLFVCGTVYCFAVWIRARYPEPIYSTELIDKPVLSWHNTGKICAYLFVHVQVIHVSAYLWMTTILLTSLSLCVCVCVSACLNACVRVESCIIICNMLIWGPIFTNRF